MTPLPVAESYEDHLERLLTSLRTRAVVRQDHELDDAYAERPLRWLLSLWRTYRSLRAIGGLSRLHCARIALGAA